ncbi:MAG: sodium:solute symporter family protein [Treponemataceae bacterium]|nr:sodium:solute symporter family protein [Treponemataceae bacterium]
MNTTFIIALAIYLLVFIIIGILDLKKIKNFTDYSVAGKNQEEFAVLMTLLATVIGASTTIGITDTVYKIGFPGIWWLAFGALGLVLQAVFLSEKVRDINADTLPDLANKTVGKSAELIIALIIVISWIGVIAGQLVAMNSLISFALGKNSRWIFAIVAIIVIAYTMIGGQMSVVKTDKVQLCLILFGMLLCMVFLYSTKDENNLEIGKNIELLNENYSLSTLFMQFFVIGGVYFLGPDIMSRNFICKDGKTAKKSAWISGCVLLAFSVIITFIGMWLRYNVAPEKLAGKSALMYAVSIMPKPLAIIMIFALLSAILSSTDTCLINASSIFAKDILKKESVLAVRLTVLVIGALSLVLALIGRSDIMALLTGAYSIYTPGVIFPLMIAIFVWHKKDLRKGLWIAAVIAGGLFGLAGSYFKPLLVKAGLPQGFFPYLPLIGMALSLILALISVKWKSQSEEKNFRI